MTELVLGSLFYCDCLERCLFQEFLDFKVKVKVTLRLTVSQSVSLGVEPHLELMTRYLVLFDSYGLVFCCVWGARSDERAGRSFVRVTACISKSSVIM
jgi:hypothetical protein